MDNDKKKIEELKNILREIEWIDFEDADEGLQIWCTVCGGAPEREKLDPRVRAGYPSMGGKGHDKNCALALAINGP